MSEASKKPHLIPELEGGRLPELEEQGKFKKKKKKEVRILETRQSLKKGSALHFSDTASVHDFFAWIPKPN